MADLALPEKSVFTIILWGSRKRLLRGLDPSLLEPQLISRVVNWARKPDRAMSDESCDSASASVEVNPLLLRDLVMLRKAGDS